MRTISKGEYNYLLGLKAKEQKNIQLYKQRIKDDPENMLWQNKLSQTFAKYYRIKYKLDNYNVK